MFITINTDASFSQKYKHGTYAFWIVSNKGKVTKSGSLRGITANPVCAEMKCIINALHYLHKHTDWLENKSKIVVNTDCLNAIHVFSGNRANIRRYKLNALIYTHLDKAMKKILADIRTGRNIKIEYRHVKAHQHTDNARHWVNEWCDLEAKKEMSLFLSERQRIVLEQANKNS